MAAIVKPRELRAFSVRVPEALYREAQQIAEARKLSVNALVNDALGLIVDTAREQEMYDAATLLGMDAEMSDVEFAAAAQSEVALANE